MKSILVILCLFVALQNVFSANFPEATRIESRAFTISIQVRQTTDYVHVCTGTLITFGWGITSAKCLITFAAPIEMIIVAGSTFKNPQSVFAQVRRVISRIPHPSYNPQVLDNDIGLVAFDKDLEPSPQIGVANFPSIPRICTGYGQGWGESTPANVPQDNIVGGFVKSPSTLQKTAQIAVNMDMCAAYHEALGQRIVKDKLICTRGYMPGNPLQKVNLLDCTMDITQLPSGSTLCTESDQGFSLTNDANEIHGVFIYNDNVCLMGGALFTKVYYYIEWIKFFTGN